MAKPQFILAVDREYLNKYSISATGIYPIDFEKFSNDVQQYLVLRQRDYLDGVGEQEVREQYSPFKINGFISKDVLPGEEDVVEGGNYAIDGFPGLYKLSPNFETVSVDIEKSPVYPYAAAHGNPLYKQLLPYTAFRVKETGEFYTYRRTKKVGEQRLSGNASVGFGGHIDLEDIVQGACSTISVDRTINSSHARELKEEVLMSENLQNWFLNYGYVDNVNFYLIVDNSDAVGQLHLGLLKIVDVSLGDILGVAEQELEFIGPLSPEKVLEQSPESWTKMIMEKFT